MRVRVGDDASVALQVARAGVRVRGEVVSKPERMIYVYGQANSSLMTDRQYKVGKGEGGFRVRRD